MTKPMTPNPPIEVPSRASTGDEFPPELLCDTGPSDEPYSLLRRLTPFNVVFPSIWEVDEYVAEHPDLGSALDGICAKVRKSFGPEVELALEVRKDPEFEDRYLALFVRQRKYESGILARIEAVVSEFMTQLEAPSGHLLITTDFARPRG